MLQKLNTRREGFTLVEIMIVVAIIGLLASIAVPNFMRARLRSQATACKQDLRMIDAAVDQWAIEQNKNKDALATCTDLKVYIKDNSALQSRMADGATFVNDSLGNPIVIPQVGHNIIVPAGTKTTTEAVTSGTDAGVSFWAPYSTGT